MSRPRPLLLDLFCGAGGAAMGYHRAGFDVVGVDLNRVGLRHYPFPSVRADALDPPFVVGADPYGKVENGETMLGHIEQVTTYIVYDRQGYEVDRATGLLSEGDVAELVQPFASEAN